MLNTLEIGPHLLTTAPDFSVGDHNQVRRNLGDLTGKNGLILGFLVDIWLSASVRRIIWLQRHAHTFIRAGYNMALVVCDQPHMLYGYYISSPTPLEFPLLSDVSGEVHRMYNMANHPGLVLLDNRRIIRHKWLMPDERVWPKIQEMLEVLSDLRPQM